MPCVRAFIARGSSSAACSATLMSIPSDPGDEVMAFDENHDRPLDEASCLVVAALADGESVDPNALRAALDEPAVREYLVDLIALRQSVRTMPELPPAQWRERSFPSRVGWIAAAAAVAMSLTAGYMAGQRTVQAAP